MIPLVLVIDDDVTLNRLMVGQLNRMGHAATGVHSWAAAQAYLQQHDPHLVLLDCPPGLEPIPLRAAAVAGRGILVTTTEATAIRDTERMMAEFTAKGLTDLYLVINRFCSEHLKNDLIPTETEIADSIGIPLLGTIPEDEAVTLATLCCEPLLIRQPTTPAGRVFTALARRLPGKDFL